MYLGIFPKLYRVQVFCSLFVTRYLLLDISYFILVVLNLGLKLTKISLCLVGQVGFLGEVDLLG